MRIQYLLPQLVSLTAGSRPCNTVYRVNHLYVKLVSQCLLQPEGRISGGRCPASLPVCSTPLFGDYPRWSMRVSPNKMPLTLADEKAQYVIPFILKELEVHQQWHAERDANVKPPPFILGMNGVQGAGKTILVRPIGFLKLLPSVLIIHSSHNNDRSRKFARSLALLCTTCPRWSFPPMTST